MRVLITMPDEWHAPLTKLAKRKKTSLSRLLCESAAELLPAKEREKLPAVKERGRPRLAKVD